MLRSAALAATVAAICATLVFSPVTAQEQPQEEEGPGQRIVTVTSFEVPFTDRPQVFPWMLEYFIPGTQLNPRVLNFRVMLHNWGSNASQVHFVSEYAEFADIESECGQPCDDYYEQHPEPEEGSPEWEEFAEARDLFNKYYAQHRDEIYTTPMMVAKSEGEMVGRVGPPPEENEENGEN